MHLYAQVSSTMLNQHQIHHMILLMIVSKIKASSIRKWSMVITVEQITQQQGEELFLQMRLQHHPLYAEHHWTPISTYLYSVVMDTVSIALARMMIMVSTSLAFS